MKKRAFSFLLALLLIVSILPGFASAAATEAVKPAPGAAKAEITEVSIGGKWYKIVDPPADGSFLLAVDGGDDLDNAAWNEILTGLLNRAEEIDLAEYNISEDDLQIYYFGVVRSNPELFYVDIGSSGCLRYSFTREGNIDCVAPLYFSEYTEADSAAFKSVGQAVIAGLPNGTREEKLLYIHDYIVTHCEYDLTYTKHNAYNCLVEGSAVCEGYALAFLYLCKLARFEVEYVSSQSINHAWDIVKLADENIKDAYYYVDCTWDDPSNDRIPSYCSHKNFLRCKEKFITECGHYDKEARIDYRDWYSARFELVYNWTTTEKYEYVNGWWKDLIRPVQWVGSLMCYAKANDNSHVYFRESDASAETALEILSGGGKWHLWSDGEKTNRYYINQDGTVQTFTTVAALGGDFYFSTPTQIYKLTTGGDMSLLYTLNDEELATGEIYGLYAEGGDLYFTLAKAPTDDGVTNVRLSLSGSDPLKLSSVKADKSSAEVGDKITWTAAATGGSGSLQYKFDVYSGNTLVSQGSFGSAKTRSYTPTAAGTYTVQVTVKDSKGATASLKGGSVTVTAGQTSTVPGDIASVTVTPQAGGKIILSWSASANAKTYVLQRHERGSSVWSTLSGSISGTTYEDITGEVGKIYQYRVRGRNGAEFGSFKTSAEVAAMSGSTPGAVSTPTVKPASGGKITVSWTAAEGAATYILQRNERGSSTWTTLASNLKETSYTDSKCTVGKVYRYRVRSRNVSAFGSFKVSVEVASMSGSAPGAVSNVTVAAAAKQVTVSWGAAEGAASYIVQRKERGASTWTTLYSNVKETSYVDTTGEVGKVYQYRVRSRNVSTYGPFKASTEVGFMAGSTPGDISKVTVKAASGKITVTWTASSGAAGYIVQRKVKGGSWENLSTNVTELSYVDKTAKAGTTYQYRIRPRNGSIYGNFKASAEVTAQ